MIGLPMAVTGILLLTGCAAVNERDGFQAAPGGVGGQLDGQLVGAGSSAQQAAMQAWQAGFNERQPGVSFSYDPVGSGGGREQFLAGGTDFAGSDAALDDEELAQAQERCGPSGVFELPNYISPNAVIYNLEGVDQLNLAPETLAGIFDGRITRWDDPAISADNPDTTLPGAPITPVHRSDESGTTQNFTDYLSGAAGDAWPHEPDGVWPVEGGEAAQGTSGVVAAVQAGQGAIGYADESQAGDLGIARVKVGDEYVAPTPEAAAAVVENSDRLEGRDEYDFAIELNRDTTGSGEYPVVLVSYHIGCVEYDDEQTAAMVRAFMDYVISAPGQEAAAEAAGSAPISDTLRGQAVRAIDAISTV